jgi:aspartate kinase
MPEKIKIGGLIHHSNMCMLEIVGIPDLPGSAGKAFSIFGNKDISLEFISETEASQGLSNISLCLSSKHCETTKSLNQRILEDTQARDIKTICPVDILTIYGPHFSSKPSIAARFCESLGKKNINMLGITTSINSITCVIHSDKLNLAQKAIHENFSFPL